MLLLTRRRETTIKSGKHQTAVSVVHKVMLLGKSKTKPLPSNKSAYELCSLFGDFFIVEKITKIRKSIPTESNDYNPEVPESSSTIRAGAQDVYSCEKGQKV